MDYWSQDTILFSKHIFFKKKKIFWKKEKNLRETFRKMLDSLQKFDACCAEDNSRKRHASSFRSTLFLPVRPTDEEIFPVGNISARRIITRNCIICKVPLKVSLSQHTFLATFLRNKAPFVRSFEDAPALFATAPFTRLHSTCDTWHTHMHTPVHGIHNIHAYAHTLTLKRYQA